MTVKKTAKPSKPVYKIRELTRADRVTVSKLIEKAADRVDTKLLNLIVASASASKGNGDEGETKSAQTQLGLEIVRILMNILNEDISEWFASLLMVSPEEFDRLPFDIEIEIVKQLQQSEEVAGFFSGAFQQFNQILASRASVRGKKAK